MKTIMFISLLLFFIGFFILVKGADFLVDGATSLAQRLKVPSFVIGLLITGIGTSIPEFSISLLANIVEKTHLGIGTILGSNTLNILFILGLSALFFPLQFRKSWVRRDMLWNVFSIFLVASFILPFGFGDGLISRMEGVFLLLMFFIWLYVVIKHSNSEEENHYKNHHVRIITLPMAWIFIFTGLIGVVLGGKWVVDGAIIIAREIGFSEALTGLIIVGIGTSLPELAVSFMASLRQEPGIAVGNIIGSNIFDFLMILGLGALVKPIFFPPGLFIDIMVTMFAAVFLFGSMFIGKLYMLKRWQGLVFVLIYAFYIIYIVGRG